MIKIDFEHCTGCGACIQRCPKQCISWKAEELGFKYPEICEENCVNCHLCEEVCPINKDLSKPIKQKIYALVNKNKDILQYSTSGGAFSAIADVVFNAGGVVYGCSMEAEFQVQHIRVTNNIDINKLQGSKYVQSDTRNTFILVEKDLKEGLLVLYSGTPCQIAGLKNFLGKEYDKLITIDIVCHGVGSQEYFNKFVSYMKIKFPKLKDIKFRNKKFVGWSIGGLIITDDNIEKPFYNYSNYYYSYFLDGDIYRNACYVCEYSNMCRIGDVTLGDFWGIEKLNHKVLSNNGCSLVIVNTIKGHQLMEKLTDVVISAANEEFATKQNAQLVHPSELREERKIRIIEYKTLTGEEIQQLYISNNLKKIIKGKIKFMIPNKWRSALRKFV